jgi:hypothetical protein
MNERPTIPMEIGSQPIAEARATAVGVGLDDPRALQILATEHWSLLAARSMLWSESFSRSAIFLSVLSASVVALSLIGTQRSDFLGFALILLPVTLFIGLGTFLRLDDSNREEALWVVGMNRIRNGYVTMVPAVAERLTAGYTDDMAGVAQSYGLPPSASYSVTHFFVTMPGMIAVIDGVLGGAIAAAALGLAGLSVPILAVAGILAAGALIGVLALRSQRSFAAFVGRMTPRFAQPPT